MFQFISSSKEIAEVRLTTHLKLMAANGAPVESYLEERLKLASHFNLVFDDKIIGLLSIEDGALLTHFSLDSKWWPRSQEAFSVAIEALQIREAIVPTFDDGFLSLAFDRHHTVKVQADLFIYCGDSIQKGRQEVELQQATHDDATSIREQTGGFFEANAEEIRCGRLFIAKTEKIVRGFGISEVGAFVPEHVSIGTFVLPEHRNQGWAAAILKAQLLRAISSNRKVVAGCWHYNDHSRRALQRIGMSPTSRLLRFKF